MNRSSFAFFVAILIHFLFFLLIYIAINNLPNTQKKQKVKENRIKVSLRELPKQIKKSGLTNKKIKSTPIAPPMPKGKQLKKIIKQKIIKQKQIKLQPNKKIKPVKLNKPQKIKKKIEPKPKKIDFTKPFIPLFEEKKIKKVKKEKESSIFDILSQDMSGTEVKQEKKRDNSGGNINQNIKELYGEEFGKLSTGQQQYILDNQEIMRRITQQILTRVARVNIPRDLNVNSTNVIEFYLHPNGDMSDFKFLKQSGIYILDDTTKETIEYAYSRYPRPKEKTLIRYNVYYNLSRY